VISPHGRGIESGRLFETVRRLHPRAPVTRYVGEWAHSKEFHASARRPLALVELGLIREPLQQRAGELHRAEPDRVVRGQPRLLLGSGDGGASGRVVEVTGVQGDRLHPRLARR
jgi:hypothetical protein